MAPEKFLLLSFFKDLIDLSIKHPGRVGFGIPCSYLLSKLILHQEHFIDTIKGDYTNTFNEFRLNGAGLKMNWRVIRENKMLTDSPDDNCGPIKVAKFQCYITGDQKKDYPEFVEAAEKLIKSRGANHR